MASYLCNGNVAPSRLVKLDTTQTGGYVIQGTAGSTSHGDPCIGVSQPGVRQPPISLLDDGFAGVQNVNQIEVVTAGESVQECWLEIGASVTNGDFLKSDTNGKGITAGTDADFYCAIALQSGTAAGQLIRVRVVSPSMRGG